MRDLIGAAMRMANRVCWKLILTVDGVGTVISRKLLAVRHVTSHTRLVSLYSTVLCMYLYLYLYLSVCVCDRRACLSDPPV